MSGIVGSFFNHRGSGIVAKLGTDGHTFNSAGAGKKAVSEAVVVVVDGVDGSKLADDAVDSEHYTDGSIDNAHIADDAIDSEHYADGSIDNAHIADDAIDSEHYADGSIDNAHIADDAIDSEHYAAASIDNAHLADNAVDTAEIADNAVSLAKMAGLARGKLIYGDSSGDPAALAAGSADEVLTHDGTDLAWAAASGGGLTVADDWKLTTTFTGSVDPITANLAQTTNGAQGQLGSAMTVSSGIWTFPSTGFWYVAARAKMLIDTANGSVRYDAIYIKATTDNSSYSACAHSSQGVYDDSAVDNMNYETFNYTIIDVTNTTNVKVQFEFDTSNTAREVYAPGGTATDTGFTFIRLGDT